MAESNPTLQQIETTLRNNLQDGKLTLTGETIDSGSLALLLSDFLKAKPLAFSNARIETAAGSVSVTGTTPFLGVADVSVTVTFDEDGDGTEVGLKTVPSSSMNLAVPGVSWFSVTDLGLDLHAPVSSKNVTGTVGGTIHLKDFDIPIAITLPPSIDGWLLKGNFKNVALPSLSSINQLAGGSDLVSFLPAELTQGIQGISISEFAVLFNLEKKTVPFISLGVQTSKDWEIIPKQLSISDVKLQLAVVDPADKARRTVAGLIRGTIGVGSADVSIEVRKMDGAGGWSLRLAPGDGITLPGLSDLLALAGDSGLSSELPSGLADSGGVVLSDLGISFDPSKKSVGSAYFALTSSNTWTLPGSSKFSISDVALDLNVNQPGDKARRAITGSVSGTFTVAGTNVPVSCELAPGDLTLTGTIPSIQLGDLVSDLCGKDLAGLGLTLPAGFADALNFTDAQISISKQGDDYALDLAATAGGLGPVEVRVVKYNGAWGFAAGFDLPDGWKLSEVGKVLSPNPLGALDDLKFSGLCLVLSSFADPAFSFPKLEVSGVSEGLNFYGTLQLEGLGLGEVGKLLNKNSLPVHAALGDLASTEFQADLGKDFALDLVPTNQVVLKNFALTLRPKPFSVNISSDADVTVQGQTLPEFSVAAGVGAGALDLSFSTKEAWPEPFGVKGLTVRSAALEVGMSPGLSVGVAGDATVGGETIKIACNFQAGGVPDMLSGSYTGRLTLQELVIGLIGVNVSELDGISLSGFHIYLVANPLGVTIAQKTYAPGIALGGAMDFYGAGAHVDVAIDKSQGFSFAIKEKIGPVSWDIQAEMHNAAFSASGSIDAAIQAQIGPIYVPDTQVKLAESIYLNTSVSGSFAIEGTTITLGKTTPLSFSWNGNDLTLGSLSIDLGPGGLADIAGEIESQIQKEATQIFGGLFNSASDDLAKVGKLLNKGFQQGASDITATLKGTGHAAGDALQAVDGAFGAGSDFAARAVMGGGYDAKEVGEGLNKALSQGADDIANIFGSNATGGAGEALLAVQGGTGGTIADAAKAVKGAGYAAAQVGKGLSQALGQSPGEAANLLKGAGYAANEVAGALRNGLGQGAEQTAKFLKDNFPQVNPGDALKAAGYAAKEVDNAVGSAGKAAGTVVNTGKKAVSTVTNTAKKAASTVSGWFR